MSTTLLQPFTPDEPTATIVLAALSDPTLTFRDIALAHHTTPESLALFLTRPDIAQRLNQTTDAITWRTRHLAANLHPRVLNLLTRILDEHERLSHLDPALRQRAHELARRAATSILRLTRIESPPLPAKLPSEPRRSTNLAALLALFDPALANVPSDAPVSPDVAVPPRQPMPSAQQVPTHTKAADAPILASPARSASDGCPGRSESDVAADSQAPGEPQDSHRPAGRTMCTSRIRDLQDRSPRASEEGETPSSDTSIPESQDQDHDLVSVGTPTNEHWP